MLEPSYFLDFIKVDEKSETEIQEKGSVYKPNIFAIQFNRLNSYNPDWELRKKLAFELFMFLSKKYGHKPFTQKYPMLKKYLHCGNDKLKKLIDELQKDGFLEIKKEKKKGVSQLNYYTVNFNKILSSLEKIYDFEGMSKENKSDSIEIMQEYIRYHAENGYKSIKKKSETGSKKTAEARSEI